MDASYIEVVAFLIHMENSRLGLTRNANALTQSTAV